MSLSEFREAEAISRYYEEWWENERDPRTIIFKALHDYVWGRIPFAQSGDRALDVGFGRGTITRMLVEKGYRVTAVDINKEFCYRLRGALPQVQVIHADISKIHFTRRYRVTTCIEVLENLRPWKLRKTLENLWYATDLLLADISNKRSMHARWVERRGWKNPFVHLYDPDEFNKLLEKVGFRIIHRRGIGVMTPITLFEGFRVTLVPRGLVRLVNRVDRWFPRNCHIYYVEAR